MRKDKENKKNPDNPVNPVQGIIFYKNRIHSIRN
jgi:hypothetical protein